jgi:S-adenosylmethionine:tRNA ribosyltransferase-isomerase
MLTAHFDYVLPADLIAQEPAEPRDAARLLVAARDGGPAVHAQVRDLPRYLERGDLLVLNRTRVIPARLFGRKDSGGELEVLLVHPEPAGEDQVAGEGPALAHAWRCIIRGRVRAGTVIRFAGTPAVATVLACYEDGTRSVAFSGMEVLALADAIGHVPLPPYIRRPDRSADRERYQTVFADRPGSVAAPTASLHFTPELLVEIQARGVTLAYVDLAIGPGTFKPVDCDRLEDFRIHAEHCCCPTETVAAVAACRARAGRVVAAGTTVVRTLESAAAQEGGFATYAGWTTLFLHPPQTVRVVDALLTNFHLPRSSLLMLVSCLTGIERLHALYAEAIQERYRFFSYGDAMLLLPGAGLSGHGRGPSLAP